MNWTDCGRIWTCSISRHYPCIYLDRPTRTIKFNEDNQSPSPNSTAGFPEHEAGVLITSAHCLKYFEIDDESRFKFNFFALRFSNLGLLYDRCPFFCHLATIVRFLEMYCFTAKLLASRPAPYPKDQGLPLIWPPSDLSSMSDPTRSLCSRSSNDQDTQTSSKH
jgi:hypothetical protein